MRQPQGIWRFSFRSLPSGLRLGSRDHAPTITLVLAITSILAIALVPAAIAAEDTDDAVGDPVVGAGDAAEPPRPEPPRPEPTLPEFVAVAPNVEPSVRTALATAMAELPETLRTIHPTLALDREPALRAADDAPLAMRLLARAALMIYSTQPPTITVFDAALGGEPSWGQPAPDAASLGTFLDDLSDVLGIESSAPHADGTWDAEWLQSAWCAFVGRVHRLAPPRRSGPAPDPCPALGDPATLDLFLRVGVSMALGGLALDDPRTLVELLVHELGHAIQFGCCADMHLRRWGELSEWRTGSDPAAVESERAAGRVAGVFRAEDPIVLIRLILGDRRRGVHFATRCMTCFPTLYGRYDMSEDFAEAVRLMTHDPERLVSTAPEKFLFINAVGFNATMSHLAPGPLWRDAESIRTARWGDRVIAALAALPQAGSETVDGPRLSAETIVALLRAHVDLLDAATLPMHAFPQMPDDMPAPIVEGATRDDFVTRVGETEVLPPPETIVRIWEERFLGRREHLAFERDVQMQLGSETSVRESLEELAAESDPQARSDRFRVLLPALQKHLGIDEAADIATEEADLLAHLGRPWLASLIRVEADLPVPPPPSWMLPTRAESADILELRVAQAHARLRRDDLPGAARAIVGLPSTTHGRFRRVELLVAVADRIDELRNGDEARPPFPDATIPDDDELLGMRRRLIETATDEAEQISWPLLRAQAKRIVSRRASPTSAPPVSATPVSAR